MQILIDYSCCSISLLLFLYFNVDVKMEYFVFQILSPPTEDELKKTDNEILESGVVRPIYKSPAERSKVHKYNI